MSKTLNYLFDPLCGWCYGAAATLPTIHEASGLALRLLPTGLFSGEGARMMDDAFAEYAWSNDQRIARLTGQVFSEQYRDQVLTDRQQTFDSGPATVALTAVHLTAPARELEALEAIQHARYVQGLDITQRQTLEQVLHGLGLSDAAAWLAKADDALLQANRERIDVSRNLMRHLGVQGVPAFVLESADGQLRLLQSSAVFSNPEAFVQELRKLA